MTNDYKLIALAVFVLPPMLVMALLTVEAWITKPRPIKSRKPRWYDRIDFG